jgi:hypothetical protein
MGNGILDTSGRPIEKKQSEAAKIGQFAVRHWATILANVLAAIAIIVSILLHRRAIRVANESNRIAEEAKTLASKQFYEANRPIISIAPMKPPQGGDYFACQLDRNERSATVVCHYRVKNVGNASAVDLTSLDQKVTVNILGKSGSAVPEIPGDVMLAPGDQFACGIAIIVTYPQERDFEELVQHIESGEMRSISSLFLVSYANALEPTERYRITASHRIFKDGAHLLSSTVESIGEERGSEK